MIKNRKSIGSIAAILFFVQAFLCFPIMKFWSANYSPSVGGLVADQLAPDQILLQLFGFREFLAGILWVRADGFFDDGNYDAILPIIRLCVLLDPHNIDVFATGMWHIGYNFTDADQRSDRRYIPASLALGALGCKENPETYELFFETGWMWFHKIQDDPWEPVHYFEEAIKRPDMIPARKDLLATALFRDNQVQAGLDEYLTLKDQAAKRLTGDSNFSDREVFDTLGNNIDTTIVRMMQRGWFAEHNAAHKDWFKTGDYDVKPPFNVGFSAKVTVVAPRVLEVQGNWNVEPVGTRIRFICRDAGYPGALKGELDWKKLATSINLEPPTNETYLQDDLFVRNRRFDKKMDMSKDPTMYPLRAKNYTLEFYYNPRFAPPHIQDKFGYDGEGFTDTNFLQNFGNRGDRVMYTTLGLTQDQILRRGEWANKTPVVKTFNYVESTNSYFQQDIIKIPTLRETSASAK